jgi:hypothetical protein
MRVAHIALMAVVVLLLGAAGTEGGSVSASDITALLREFGFPIFVSLWFMWRLEKRLDAFTESIQKLLTVVTVMSKSIDEISTRPPPKAGTLDQTKGIAS